MKATRPAPRRGAFSQPGFSGGRTASLAVARVGAFTLLEILLVLGLLAIISTVLIGGSTRVLATKPVTAEDVFWQASSEARKMALENGREVRVAFADDQERGKRFTLDDGTAAREFSVTAGGDVTVSFMPGQKNAGNAIVLAGQVIETETVPFVTYYSDGTCSAFRVQIRVGVSTHVLSIDPWTCSPVLPAEK
jgi:type II secretory pathway pseudopilin PulG